MSLHLLPRENIEFTSKFRKIVEINRLLTRAFILVSGVSIYLAEALGWEEPPPSPAPTAINPDVRPLGTYETKTTSRYRKHLISTILEK